MAIVAPQHWFLGPDQTLQRPHFTSGDAATAFIDDKGYMADHRTLISTCTQDLFIAGWRGAGEQILNSTFEKGEISRDRFIDVVAAAANRGCSVKALIFNVPGTEVPRPFRICHAKENVDFAKAVFAAGGEAQLNSRLALVPASANHQNFIVSTSNPDDRHTVYVGGIDVCLDR